MDLRGGCLCGAVRYELGRAPIFMSQCYCTDCQKESGAGHLTFVAVPDTAMAVTGTLKSYTRQADSGEPVERLFCPDCGSTLACRPAALSGLSLIRAGTLDDSSGVVPSHAVFARSAQNWDRPPEGLRLFDGMPPPKPPKS